MHHGIQVHATDFISAGSSRW